MNSTPSARPILRAGYNSLVPLQYQSDLPILTCQQVNTKPPIKPDQLHFSIHRAHWWLQICHWLGLSPEDYIPSTVEQPVVVAINRHARQRTDRAKRHHHNSAEEQASMLCSIQPEVSMNKFSEQNKAVAAATNPAANKTNAPAANSVADKKATADKNTAAASTNQQTAQPSAGKKDAFNGKWPSQIQAAKATWEKLSEKELIGSAGNEVSLTDLVQQRYSLSHDVASKQVKTFITQCHC
jgi:hypothetical protein